MIQDIVILTRKHMGETASIKLNRAHIMWVRHDDYGHHIHLVDGSAITVTTCPYNAKPL